MARSHLNPPSSRFIDLTGQQFGRLTVIEQAPHMHGRVAWSVLCECGVRTQVIAKTLRNKGTQSCGCLRKEKRAIEDRFWEKVDKNGPLPSHAPELGPCWIWKGARNKAEYGLIGIRGITGGRLRSSLAHRVSYLLHVGDIPDGLWVLHRCDNPPCIRGKHLFLGTHQDNMRDAIAKGRFKNPLNGIMNGAKTHCLHGHEFTIENTRIGTQKGGGICRQCRTCNHERYLRVKDKPQFR